MRVQPCEKKDFFFLEFVFDVIRPFITKKKDLEKVDDSNLNLSIVEKDFNS